MGKLVPFEKREKQDRPAARSEDATGAEILMFTGVRYQRETPDLPDRPSPSTGVKRKRG